LSTMASAIQAYNAEGAQALAAPPSDHPSFY
jgi:hypothetical protein